MSRLGPRSSSRPGAAPAAFLLAGLLLAGPGCKPAPRQLVYDLAQRLPVADRWSRREVVLFGTPASEPHQAEGFYREAGTPEGDGFVWARGEAELSLTWPEPALRAAVVELAPYRGVKGQQVEVRLNGAPVARFALNDLRHRYRFSLPAEVQRPGENRLRFVFAATASPADKDPKNPDRRQLAAAFYNLTVGGEGEAALDDLLARDAPPPFAVALSAGVPSLLQAGTSVVRYAIRLPEAAELRFEPDLHAAARAAGATAAFRVTVEEKAGEEREVWSGSMGPGDRKAREVSVGLPGGAGAIVRLGLHVAGAAEDRFAWGVWKAPRVLGRGGEDPLLTGRPQEAAAPADGRGQAPGATSVLLVMLDAARARQLGCYGYGRATSPEIDRIAAEGVVFERAYTPAVYTLGAMSSVWTSQYPDRHHGELSYADKLPRGLLTLTEALGARGVHTAGFVANAMAGRALGFERGFAEFHEVFRRFPELGSRGEALARVLPGWLRQQGGRRFFAYLHFREPHFPYDPPPPFDTRFGSDAPLTKEQRRDKAWYQDVNQGRRRPSPEQIAHLVRLYDGNLAYVDEQVGALRRALEAAGLWDRTAVVIASDHGEQLYEHGYISHSAQVYEDSVRVPLIFRLPGGPKGARVRGLVDLLDLAPTILDLFHVPLPEGSFQGRSLLPMLAGAPGKPAVLSRTVWERPVYALRDERFKFIYDTRTGQAELYDLEGDPAEGRDLASSEPLRSDYYRQALHDWILRLKPVRAAAPEKAEMTREQCENLKALGYIDACR